MLLLNGASTSSKENQATCSVVPASSRRTIGGSTGKCGLPRCRRRRITLGFLYWYKNSLKVKKEFFRCLRTTHSQTRRQNTSAPNGISLALPSQASTHGGRERPSPHIFLR